MHFTIHIITPTHVVYTILDVENTLIWHWGGHFRTKGASSHSESQKSSFSDQ